MLFPTLLLLTSAVATWAAPIPSNTGSGASTKDNTIGVSVKTNVTAPHVSTTNGWPFNANDNGKAFGISQNVRTGTSSVETIDGAPAFVAKYPKGSYAGAAKPHPGIAGFIVEGNGGSGADLDNALEAVMTYEVKFPKGFDFVLAGKLPGLYGGDNEQIAKTCAGGHHNDECWSARLMWREQGKGELYGYLPTPNQKLPVCKGKCNVKFGASIGTGAWKFVPGEWAQVTERVRLNDVGSSNGEIEVSVNGESKVHVKQLTLRTKSAGRIRGAMVHTFFGGSSIPDYASTKDQQAFFRKFSIKTTQKL